MIDTSTTSCYNVIAEAYGTGGVLLYKRRLFTIDIVGRAPFTRGLYVPAVRFSNDGEPSGGRFAMLRTCGFCGGTFNANSSEVKRGWGKYCSHSCATSARNKMVSKFPSMEARFWSKVIRSADEDGCWLWTGACYKKDGYGAFDNHKAHRVAWELTYGPIPDGLLVCHHCDNRACVRPDHLFLGTQADNIHDCMAKGRFLTGDKAFPHLHPELYRGDRHAGVKLTAEEVVEIRRLHRNHELTLDQLAARFGVRNGCIQAVVYRNSWAYLEDDGK